MNEYRAVFGSPYQEGPTGRGPERTTLEAAIEDHPQRSEETHEHLIGVEVRKVEPWASVPLETLLARERD